MGSQSELVVDHIVAGNGYDMSVKRLSLLAPELQSKIVTNSGAPKLDSNFQSSAHGLYFIGPTSAKSFGPLFRFVAGADYSAKRLSRQLSFPD